MKYSSIFIIIILFIAASTYHVQAKNKEEDLQAAIIIDDFGGGIGGVGDFLNGAVPITAAVMPFSEHSKDHAIKAHNRGFEVMVHLPMQPKKGKISWLGPNPITKTLSTEEVKERVEKAIESVPYAKGLNNHMGSLVVEDERIVRAIVEVAKKHQMYIVDSGTSGKTKFPKVAKELGVPIVMRDVFLDDVSSVHYVKKQMKRLAKITEKHKKGIAIGHVGVTGKVCSTGIFESMPEFKKRNIEIVPVSELLNEEIQEKYFEFIH
ncbi:divergent polysaccharide deacetylase family protein [Bacillus sp. PS06]|uniref:divergent polysaccharide deacetylase family protein n=1 Tax=Bacillus sp. PS06 TaxID=2764176 RepID=UPI0017812F5E|nr:divergent polysaccharide deacetylase family protein [Bacillus sp. PS06]MBD8067693.1 divergent polysaccharide deacetylase family protein [Bacillus sp. PS06]